MFSPTLPLLCTSRPESRYLSLSYVALPAVVTQRFRLRGESLPLPTGDMIASTRSMSDVSQSPQHVAATRGSFPWLYSSYCRLGTPSEPHAGGRDAGDEA